MSGSPCSLSLCPPRSLYLLSLSLSLSKLVKERWSPTQAQKEVNTCLVSDLESVPSAPDWVCCLLGALSGAKRERSLEQRRQHHLSVCPKPPSFHGTDTGPGIVDDVQRYPGVQEQSHWGDPGVGEAWLQAPVLPF